MRISNQNATDNPRRSRGSGFRSVLRRLSAICLSRPRADLPNIALFTLSLKTHPTSSLPSLTRTYLDSTTKNGHKRVRKTRARIDRKRKQNEICTPVKQLRP